MAWVQCHQAEIQPQEFRQSPLIPSGLVQMHRKIPNAFYFPEGLVSFVKIFDLNVIFLIFTLFVKFLLF